MEFMPLRHSEEPGQSVVAELSDPYPSAKHRGWYYCAVRGPSPPGSAPPPDQVGFAGASPCTLWTTLCHGKLPVDAACDPRYEHGTRMLVRRAFDDALTETCWTPLGHTTILFATVRAVHYTNYVSKAKAQLYM